jgi:hypothetical protein
MQRHFHQNGESQLIANTPRPTHEGGFFDQVVAAPGLKARSADSLCSEGKREAYQSTCGQIFRELPPETGGLAHEIQRAASTAERTKLGVEGNGNSQSESLG